MRPPQPAKRTEYKKPSRINPVSISILLVMAGLAYVGYCLWPVLALRAAAKDELYGVLPQLYRAQLKAPGLIEPEIVRIRKEVVANLRKDGVKDPRLQVILTHNKKVVTAEARFTLVAFFPWLDKTRPFPIVLHVETSAERIDW